MLTQKCMEFFIRNVYHFFFLKSLKIRFITLTYKGDNLQNLPPPPYKSMCVYILCVARGSLNNFSLFYLFFYDNTFLNSRKREL